MIYQNEKVRIVPLTKAHISERYLSWFHDAETTRHNSHGLFPYTRKAMTEYVDLVESGGDRGKIVWAIEMRPPGEVWRHVGNCALDRISWIYRSAEVTIVIGEDEARGKGVGKQAVAWLLEHAFLKLGLNRVWTGTAETNKGMRGVAATLGMLTEGVFRQGMFLHGKFVDIHMYAILADDYRTYWIEGRYAF